jgi:hypothetical protein
MRPVARRTLLLCSVSSVEVASEPITPGIAWRLLPEACVLGIDTGLALRIEPLARDPMLAPARLAAG